MYTKYPITYMIFFIKTIIEEHAVQLITVISAPADGGPKS
jgi:hypothetical protein